MVLSNLFGKKLNIVNKSTSYDFKNGPRLLFIGSLIGILLVSLVLRLYNLNYNSPFNDEAIYIVVGRLGIFQWDWWSYNAAAWMAGYPYIYPTFTALVYMTGGILGSRLLNVIFGVLSIELIFYLTLQFSKFKDNRRYIAGLIAATIVGFASVSFFISRLATYDIPSFYFLFLGFTLLLHAQKPETNTGKWYFLSALSLIFAFFTKLIVGVYIPIILIYSFFSLRNLDSTHRHFWKSYFIFPIFLTLSLYFLGNLSSLIKYTHIATSKETISLAAMTQKLIQFDTYIWFFYFAGSLGLLIKKEWLKWATLTFCGLLIILPHILTLKGEYTLQKHVYMMVAFFAAIAGLGIANIIFLFKNNIYRVLMTIPVLFSLIAFSFYSYMNASQYNKLWDNADPMLNKLNSEVKYGDKVLAEVGAAAILATYDKNLPTNTTTFDWFEYHNVTGEKAYVNAMRELYFNYIELEREDRPEDKSHSTMHNIIKANLKDNYSPIYKEKGFVIYKRNY